MLEAKDLVKADIAVLGKGKSDPYAVIRGKVITITVLGRGKGGGRNEIGACGWGSGGEQVRNYIQ